MGLSFQAKGVTLSYKEGKPVRYKAQQVTYPTIKSKDLLAYASSAANVPQSNIECCIQGLIEAIAYFCINGHRVVLPEVGGFFLGVKSKAVSLSENLNVKQVIQSTRLLFAPATELREAMTETSCDSVRPSNGTIEANATEGGSAEGGEGTGSNGGNTGGSSDQGNDGPPPEGGGFGG